MSNPVDRTVPYKADVTVATTPSTIGFVEIDGPTPAEAHTTLMRVTRQEKAVSPHDTYLTDAGWGS